MRKRGGAESNEEVPSEGVSERAYYREIHTKGNAESIVTGSRMGDCAAAAGCSVAR